MENIVNESVFSSSLTNKFHCILNTLFLVQYLQFYMNVFVHFIVCIRLIVRNCMHSSFVLYAPELYPYAPEFLTVRTSVQYCKHQSFDLYALELCNVRIRVFTVRTRVQYCTNQGFVPYSPEFCSVRNRVLCCTQLTLVLYAP